MKITLGQSTDGNTIEITSEQLDHHLYMLGKSGMGKTSCLTNISIDLMAAKPKAGLCVIDPLGALVEEIKRRIPDHRADDVILFEARDQDYPFCLNPFAPEPPPHLLGQWADHVMSIFQLICDDADWNSRTKQALRNIVITLLSRNKIEGLMGEEWPAALDEVSALLNLEVEDEGGKPRWRGGKVTAYREGFYTLLEESGHIPVLRFWRQFYDKVMTPRPKAEISAAIGGAADQHLANPIVRNIVGQTKTKINFLDVMNEGKILLVDLSGIGDASADFLGSIIMAQLASATLQRERYAEPHFYIVADELYRYGNDAFRYISRQGRNFNVHLIAAQQDQTDMRPSQRGLMGNASNRVYFQLVPSDSLEQAHGFNKTPPPADDEFRPRLRYMRSLRVDLYRDDKKVLYRCWERLGVLARIYNGEPVDWREVSDVRGWIEALRRVLVRRYSEDHLTCLDEVLASIRAGKEPVISSDAFDQIQEWLQGGGFNENGSYINAYIQERTVYPDTPGNYHFSSSTSPNVEISPMNQRSSSTTSYSTETGPIFDRVPGRPRAFADVYQQIANELTHLPRQHAKCQLAALDNDPPMEATVKIRQLEPEVADWAQRWASIKERSQQEYCRPVEEVEEEAKRRDSVMSRAVETWHAQSGESREYHADGDGLKSANGAPIGRR